MPSRASQSSDPFDVAPAGLAGRRGTRARDRRSEVLVDEAALAGRRRVGRPRGSTRERILDAALDLFTDNGYDKTSLREIADQLGFTKAALYYHFEHKEDILLALHLRLHALGRDAVERMAKTDRATNDVRVWAELLDRFVEEVLENRRLFLFHVRNFNALANVIGRHSDDDHEDMEEQLSKLLADKDVPAAVRVRMACALGAVFGALMRWGDAFADLDPDEMGVMVRQVVDGMLRPLFTPEVTPATRGSHGVRRSPRRRV